MNNFADNLDHLMNIHGLTDYRLAERIGVSRSTITRWRNGIRSPKLPLLPKIAGIFGVTPEDLVGTCDTSILSEINVVARQLAYERLQNVYAYATDQLAEQKCEESKVVAFPAPKHEEEHRPKPEPEDDPTEDTAIDGIVAARYGAFNDNRSEPVDTVPIPVQVIPCSYDYCFKVAGDSMSPAYNDGEIIFVKKTDAATSGMIAVVEIDGLAYVKKLLFEGNRLCCHSLNDDVDAATGKRIYPDFYADEYDSIEVIGQVIGSYAFR